VIQTSISKIVNVRNSSALQLIVIKGKTLLNALFSLVEHIGPWYIADSGRDIGFNDLWYQNLDLDENGTSVMFQESGLYLIYAQVQDDTFVQLVM